jgi:hypothetical protein
VDLCDDLRAQEHLLGALRRFCAEKNN